MHFDQLLDFPILLILFLHTLLLCLNYFTLWMLDFFNTIRVSYNLDPGQAQHMSGLTCVQTVCKGYQQTRKVAPSGQRVKYKTTCGYYFLAKSLAKLITFGSNFFHLAKVLATTNSEPG